MVKIENECRGCATESYPCLGSSCRYRHVPVCYCDKCNQETDEDEFYDYDGEQVCEECLLKIIPKVRVQDYAD